MVPGSQCPQYSAISHRRGAGPWLGAQAEPGPGATGPNLRTHPRHTAVASSPSNSFRKPPLHHHSGSYQPHHPVVRGFSSSSGAPRSRFGHGGHCLSQQSYVITAVRPGAAARRSRRGTHRGIPCASRQDSAQRRGIHLPSFPVCCLNCNERSLPPSPKRY